MSAETSAGFRKRGFRGRDIPSDAIVNTCIKCGLCLPTCPTYQLTLDERSSPRGRIHLIQSVLEGNLDIGDRTFRAQMSECLGCRNCEPVCPSGVAFGSLLEDARAQIAAADATSGAALLKRIAFDLPLFDLRILRMLAVAVLAFEVSGLRRLMRASGVIERLGLTRLESLLPAPLGRPFVAGGATYSARTRPDRGSLALFAGCVMGAMFGNVQRATVRNLTRSGWSVEVPRGQGCCGALHLHAGYKERARVLARRTIEAFEASATSSIVVNAAGCGAAMKEYGHLLADEPDWAQRAEAFAARVRDVSEVIAAAPLEAAGLRSLPLRVAYQDPCHLAHAQRIKQEPRAIIDAIPGVARVEMAEADRCCGSAGVYNLTHPDFADRLAKRKVSAAVEAGADRIITSNPGCQIHLSAVSRRSGGPLVQHLMELLDEAYDREVDAGHGAPGGLLLTAGAIVIAGVALLVLRRTR